MHPAPDLWTHPSAVYHYVQCGVCGCVQIATYPNNVEDIYPRNYYAHAVSDIPPINPPAKWLRKQWIDYGLTGTNPLGWMLGSLRPLPPWYRTAGKLGLRRTWSVLDVGCGNGIFLLWLGRAGFNNVVGLDPYIEGDRALPEGVKLFRRSIFDETDTYDFIVLNHSFEHMPEPGRVLTALCGRLRDRGMVMINMPVVGFAWREYGIHWWNLDSPRHFYLHTRQSLQTVCQKAGFEIAEAVYASTYWQFVGSDLLRKGFTRQQIEGEEFSVATFYDKNQISAWKERAKTLNRGCDGDEAIFFLKKIGPRSGRQ